MSTKPYDQAFKFIVEQDPESLLLLLGAITADEHPVIELLPREISIAAVLPDQPYRVTSSRGERIVHVEAWTYWERPIPHRMAEYGPLHWFKYRLPVESYVLLLTPHGCPSRQPRTGVIEAGDTRLRTRFRIIKLWKLSAREALASGRQALLPFVPLMKGKREEVETGVEAVRAIRDEALRRESALHFVMLGGLRYDRFDLLEMIGRKGMISLEQLRDSSFYQFILEEGETKGIALGREEGREQGREETLKSMLATTAD
ncbi:MAG: hypothetical protein ABI977_26295, partial [Acidobacteriota bacterium]